jgi:hypothetical protein
MRPNLSLENIASTLAALGTTALVACGGSAPAPSSPVQSNEVTPAATSATPGQASCSAAGCGANKGKGGDTKAAAEGHCGASAKHDPGQASCAAKGGDAKPDSTTPSTGAAAGSSPAATPAAAATTDAKGGDKPTAAAATTKPKAPAASGSGKKPGAGQASCGAGTCGADPKKK